MINTHTINTETVENKINYNESMATNSKSKSKKYIPDIDEDIWKDMLRIKNKNSALGN